MLCRKATGIIYSWFHGQWLRSRWTNMATLQGIFHGLQFSCFGRYILQNILNIFTISRYDVVDWLMRSLVGLQWQDKLANRGNKDGWSGRCGQLELVGSNFPGSIFTGIPIPWQGNLHTIEILVQADIPNQINLIAFLLPVENYHPNPFQIQAWIRAQ